MYSIYKCLHEENNPYLCLAGIPAIKTSRWRKKNN